MGGAREQIQPSGAGMRAAGEVTSVSPACSPPAASPCISRHATYFLSLGKRPHEWSLLPPERTEWRGKKRGEQLEVLRHPSCGNERSRRPLGKAEWDLMGILSC